MAVEVLKSIVQALRPAAPLVRARTLSPRQPPSDSKQEEIMAEETPNTSDSAAQGRRLELLLDVPLDLSVELGRARMSIQDLLNLSPGSVIELDKSRGRGARHPY